MLSDQLSTVFLNLSFNKVGGFKKNENYRNSRVCIKCFNETKTYIKALEALFKRVVVVVHK